MAKIKCDKPGDLLAPLPVVMVSCGEGEEKNIITIAWTGIINSEPPMTYISVRKSRHSHDIIEKNKEFVINLTTEDLARQTDWCGVRSGKNVDKFKEMKLTPADASIVKCPMIAESPVNLECRVVQVIELPSHDMFMAEIIAVHIDEELVDPKGRYTLEKAGLLSFVHGEYYGIKSRRLGGFGFSVMKPKTRKRISRQRRDAQRAARRKK